VTEPSPTKTRARKAPAKPNRNAGGGKESALSTLTGRFYDAALEEGPLPRFLETMSAAMAEHGIAMVIQEEARGSEASGDDPDEGNTASGDTATLEQSAQDAAHDEFVADGQDDPSGEAADDPLAPITLGYFRGADAEHRAKLVVRHNDADAAAKNPDAMSLIDLAAHLRRSIQIHRGIVGRRVQGSAAERVLDAVPIGVILLNATCQVLNQNKMADDILSQHDGLFVDRTGLCTAVPKESARLRRVIAQVASSGEDPDRTPVGVIRVERPSLSSAWLLIVVPIVAAPHEEGVMPLAVIFVSDGERTPEIPPEVLERLFGLTPAESRLLVALVDGHSLDEAATMFSVSKNTLRNQLNQIFRKTETSKQSELVRMVLTSPAPVLMSAGRKKPD